MSTSHQVKTNIARRQSIAGDNNLLLEKIYKYYVPGENIDGIALNGLGQLFHDLNIGNNSLTCNDLELIFHRNVQKEEDENYMVTGKRKILRRLPYNGMATCLVDFAKMCYGHTLHQIGHFGGKLLSAANTWNSEKAMLQKLLESHVAPLLWRKEHGHSKSMMSPTFTRFGEDEVHEDGDYYDNTFGDDTTFEDDKKKMLSKHLMTDFWYDEQFKKRMYKRDMLTLLSLNSSWMKQLYSNHVIWKHSHSTQGGRSTQTQTILLQGGPPGIKQKPGGPIPLPSHSQKKTTSMPSSSSSSSSSSPSWEQVVTGKGLFMREEQYLDSLKKIGVFPALMNEQDLLKLYYWLTKKGKRRMYFCQYQQCLVGLGLLLWERRNHRSFRNSMFYDDVQLIKKNGLCVRWLFEQMRTNMKVGPRR